jgi:hypothetical protein
MVAAVRTRLPVLNGFAKFQLVPRFRGICTVRGRLTPDSRVLLVKSLVNIFLSNSLPILRVAFKPRFSSSPPILPRSLPARAVYQWQLMGVLG